MFYIAAYLKNDILKFGSLYVLYSVRASDGIFFLVLRLHKNNTFENKGEEGELKASIRLLVFSSG